MFLIYVIYLYNNLVGDKFFFRYKSKLIRITIINNRKY